jgi:hypothetical protein
MIERIEEILGLLRRLPLKEEEHADEGSAASRPLH